MNLVTLDCNWRYLCKLVVSAIDKCRDEHICKYYIYICMCYLHIQVSMSSFH